MPAAVALRVGAAGQGGLDAQHDLARRRARARPRARRARRAAPSSAPRSRCEHHLERLAAAVAREAVGERVEPEHAVDEALALDGAARDQRERLAQVARRRRAQRRAPRARGDRRARRRAAASAPPLKSTSCPPGSSSGSASASAQRRTAARRRSARPRRVRAKPSSAARPRPARTRARARARASRARAAPARRAGRSSPRRPPAASPGRPSMPRRTQASGSTNEPARSLTWSGSGSSGVRHVLRPRRRSARRIRRARARSRRTRRRAARGRPGSTRRRRTGTWWASATRRPAGRAPSTTTPAISWPSTEPAGAPPGRSFSTSLPHSPQARTRTRTPPGGAVGEGSSRSAGDPPGVTVTASMSAQSLVGGLAAERTPLSRRRASRRASSATCAPAAVDERAAVRRGRPRAARRRRPTRSRAASRSASQNTRQWLERAERGDAADREARVLAHARGVGASDRGRPRPPPGSSSSRRLSPATSASTGVSSHMNTSDLTICPTLAPTAAAASTAVRAESGVSTIVALETRGAQGIADALARVRAAGVLTPRILGQIGAARRRQAARGSASASSAASTSSSAATMAGSNCEPAQRRSSCSAVLDAARAGVRAHLRHGRERVGHGDDARLDRDRERPRARRGSRRRRSARGGGGSRARPACSAGMRSTICSPSSGWPRMIAHSSSSSIIGLSSTRSGTDSLPMSCSQPPSSQRSAVRESRCSAAGDARGQRGDVGRVLRRSALAHADGDRERLGDADRLGPLGDQVALGDLAREQHAVAAAPLGRVERAVGLLDERVEALLRRVSGVAPPDTSTVRCSPSTTIGRLSIARCSSTARCAELALVADLAEQDGELLAAPARHAVVAGSQPRAGGGRPRRARGRRRRGRARR